MIAAKDALCILKYTLNQYQISGKNIDAANVDRSADGVRVKDALIILKYTLGQMTINQQ